MKFLFLLSSCWCYATLQEVTSHMLSNEQIGKNNKILSFSQYLHIFCWHPCKQKGRPRFFIRSREKNLGIFLTFWGSRELFVLLCLKRKIFTTKMNSILYSLQKFTLHIWDDGEGFFFTGKVRSWLQMDLYFTLNWTKSRFHWKLLQNVDLSSIIFSPNSN